MEIVLASAARTPIGAFQGALASVSAPRLGATAIAGAVGRAGLRPDQIDLVLMGQVLAAGAGQAPARQAALSAGIPASVPTVTLNKMCGSGLEAIQQAARAVAVGDARIVVAGGMESMSNAPYLLPGARGGLRLGHGTVLDSVVHDGLWDVQSDAHMGTCADACARDRGIARETQDAFAVRSYRRAQAATRDGVAAHEIVPVEVTGRKGTVSVVDRDEGPDAVDVDRVASLRPAFGADGTVTAANASTINDGAAAVVVTSREEADRLGLPVLAGIRGFGVHAREPEWFTLAPIDAMRSLFDRVGWAPGEVDRYEINEAFAVVTLAAMQAFDLDENRVDPLGGAVSLGHPIGASGARIVVTLLNALRVADGRRGVAAICIGGGEALAAAVERDGATP
ncbi:MAG: thiolase family protein [Trueperaceae bacterium]